MIIRARAINLSDKLDMAFLSNESLILIKGPLGATSLSCPLTFSLKSRHTRFLSSF